MIGQKISMTTCSRIQLKGLPKNFSCLDLTAGFGKDALEISKIVNCKSLILVEKEAWVFELLVDGIKNTSCSRADDLLKKNLKYSIWMVLSS